jgi:hypothetical protein
MQKKKKNSNQDRLTFSLFYGHSLLNHVQLFPTTDKVIPAYCFLEVTTD